MACSACEAARRAAQAKQQSAPVRQVQTKAAVTQPGAKQVALRNKLRFTGK